MREDHATAVKNFDYAELRDIVGTFYVQCELVSKHSHCVVVFPHPPEYLNLNLWGIDFKSIRIRDKTMESMRLQENEHLRKLYEYFHRTNSSNLAGWVFEMIVHRVLSDGWRSGPMPQPIRMASDGRAPPIFFINHSSSTPDTSLSFGPLRTGTRAITRVNFTDHQLSDVTLDNDEYYIPTAVNDPSLTRSPSISTHILS